MGERSETHQNSPQRHREHRGTEKRTIYHEGRKGHAMVAMGSERLRVLCVPIASFALKRLFFCGRRGFVGGGMMGFAALSPSYNFAMPKSAAILSRAARSSGGIG